ncbi:MAG: ATP-binding protein [Acidobacteria bacterium]|nr:ATP-binding protein [Acidobacteriota bacterium]
MMQQNSLYFMEIAAGLAVVLILALIFLIGNRKINARRDKAASDMPMDFRATVAKLHAVIANYSGVIWSVNRDNIITLFNGLYLSEIGITPDFLEGKSLEAARQKNRHLDIIESVRETLEEGVSHDWISDIDGRIFRSRTIPIYDEDGNVNGVVGSSDDITETIKLQKELEIAVEKSQSAVQALKSAQITVSAMFESNPHMNILFDENFRLVDCNPAAYGFMGFKTKEDMQSGFIERITQSVPEFQSDGRKSASLSEMLMTAAKEGYAKFETEFAIDGATRILSVELKKIPYEESFAIVAYVFDMTEIRRREMELIRQDRQLLEAAEEARAANQAKSAFLSTMSHEIRTPMNAILGITEIQLQNESLEPGTSEAFGKIYNSGALLLGIINDILDMSKIEAGKLELSITEYRLASLINDTAQVNILRIGSKPINFRLDIDENIPSALIGDELRIKQVLNNLLSNAFKYTAKGMVTLSVSAETDGGREDEATIVFSIKDTGQGMTHEQINRLFDEYARFNLAANRTTEGTGLGMSITRNLIRMMNGEIVVESEPGKGSVFTVRIPQGYAGAGPLGRELAENLQQFQTISGDYTKKVRIFREQMPYGSVMVVDDVETNIYVARGLLSPYRLRVDSAGSGFAAIEKIRDGNTYDIVFMDHMMPNMDGMETTKIIRDMGYRGIIVALTANAVVGQSDIFLKNGFDDFISKPIDIRQLNTLLNKFIRDRHQPEALEAARRQADDGKEQNAGKEPPAIDPGLAEIFVRDASKTLATLREILAKQGGFSEEDTRTYIISIHGIKSALANIGRPELSAAARELEQAGRDNNTDVMSTGTRAFLDSLQALIKELAPGAEETGDETLEEDRPYILERLRAVKEACEAYDKKTARGVIAKIREKTWSPPTMELLDVIDEHLLHSEFDEIVIAVNKVQ